MGRERLAGSLVLILPIATVGRIGSGLSRRSCVALEHHSRLPTRELHEVTFGEALPEPSAGEGMSHHVRGWRIRAIGDSVTSPSASANRKNTLEGPEAGSMPSPESDAQGVRR